MSHKKGETYSVLLRSADGIGDDASNVRFFINWENILPLQYKAFKVKAFFSSYEDANHTPEYAFVSVSSLSLREYDSRSKGKGNTLVIAEAVEGKNHPFYKTTYSDTEWLTTDYPRSTDCVVEVKDIDGDFITDLGFWWLLIQFYPIEH